MQSDSWHTKYSYPIDLINKQRVKNKEEEKMGAPSVTTSNFQAEVLNSDKPVLVDFWAEWCGPCRMVAPILDEIAAEHGDKLKIVKLNTDEESALAIQYGVQSIPTLHVFKGGQVVKTVIGAKPKPALLKDLAEFI
jgi:thioredoxin 1